MTTHSNKEYMVQWRLKNPDKVRQYTISKRGDYNKNQNLKKKFGITLEEYNKMYQEQQGQCAICEKQWEVLHVDHDHETGRIRGLLCQHCNTSLGTFGDNIEGIMKVLSYLERNND